MTSRHESVTVLLIVLLLCSLVFNFYQGKEVNRLVKDLGELERTHETLMREIGALEDEMDQDNKLVIDNLSSDSTGFIRN